VSKPDRSEQGVQRSKAKSRNKRCYEIQDLLSKSKKMKLFFRKAVFESLRLLYSRFRL